VYAVIWVFLLLCWCMGLGIADFGLLVIVLVAGVVFILKLGFFREGVFVLRESFEIALSIV
jgi:hypothetical protein